MQSAAPLTRDLVLVGGGHAHALVLRRWGMDPLPGARLTLIDPLPVTAYTGMLPGHVAGHYARDDLEIDLVRLARFAGARLIQARATGIDREARTVFLEGGRQLRYDVASLDIGITSDMPDLPGFAEHGHPAKPLDRFAADWAAFLARIEAGESAPSVAVIGGGVAGTELALAMAHRLRAEGHAAQVSLLDKSEPPTGLSPRAGAALTARLDGLRIERMSGAVVRKVTEDGVVLEDGRAIPAAFVVGAAGARPQDWVSKLGLPHQNGYLSVTETLASEGDPRLFAAGDCAHYAFAPRPKAGIYAVRAAPVLYRNLRAALGAGRAKPFKPQKGYLKIVSAGERYAVADKWSLAIRGPLVWHWKDRIDRRFMEKLTELSPMRSAAPEGEAAEGVREAMSGPPPCAGCGAKVARGDLAAALAKVPSAARADVLSEPGDDAAILGIGDVRQVVTTDHLRAMTEDPALMARIAAIHALGDIWAMGAAPQAALATIILPRMAPALQRNALAEITTAAGAIFAAEGAALAGGHTTLGSELTIGFSITGLCQGAPVTLAGAEAGDVLLLTKPVGSGTVMAGEMRLEASGRDVTETLQIMARPQGEAARRLATVARAMTDVTGFGLAGHLLGICDASGIGAELDIGAVPLMPGAAELAARGVRSTLHASNLDWSGGRIDAKKATLDSPAAVLLHDPQTAGGLLAAVPEAEAEALVRVIPDAVRIGRIVDGPPRIALL
ncbi:selenide, water dikinase SelD [Roseicyclus sp. F158]|uniref:Selenide, water dikinase SelD n=1 Tax=Tropicimonas omnivorans TaxID=3075590 RepID=A0ABU3DDH8_9RHOB|nr:selenide, water dikinase SelD [Roseicyclus sp. F158]MDT0681599.1 selenide, water dikinase SelD [Roseicyclus sp. F158]